MFVSNVAARATGNQSVCGPNPEDQHLIPPAKFFNKKDTLRLCVRKLKIRITNRARLRIGTKSLRREKRKCGECANSVNDISVCDSVDENVGDFMYMDVIIKCTKVAALLDTGSSIHIISTSLYEK